MNDPYKFEFTIRSKRFGDLLVEGSRDGIALSQTDVVGTRSFVDQDEFISLDIKETFEFHRKLGEAIAKWPAND